MLLALDLGNTNLTCGLFEDGHLRQTFRLETRRQRTADEHAVLLRQMLALRAIETDQVRSSVLASVVPPLTDGIVEAVRLAFGVEALVVGPGVKTGISVLCDNSHEVGADRIVNAVAARELAAQMAPPGHERGAIVVDFGTATTLDCVSPQGEYLGGAIVPGVQVSLDGLLSRAAKLHPVEMVAPPRVIGRNTTHARHSGIVHGYSSLVDGLVAKLRADLPFECSVVATGGLATLIAQHAPSVEHVEPELTLRGLWLLHHRNGNSLDRPAP